MHLESSRGGDNLALWRQGPKASSSRLKGVDLETGVSSLAEVTSLPPSMQQLPFPQLWQPKIWPGIESPISVWDPS